jgi:hypothetical protein
VLYGVAAVFDPEFERRSQGTLHRVPIMLVLGLIQVYFGFMVPNRSRKFLIEERYKTLNEEC